MQPNRESILFLAVLVFLVGCQLKPQYLTVASATAAASCSSRPESSRSYADLLISPPSTPKEAVAALAFTSDGQTMWVAFSREPVGQGGQLVQIRHVDWRGLRMLELDSLNERFTRFNGDATLLVTFRQERSIQPPALSQYSPIFTYGLKVWNTTTGNLVPRQGYTEGSLVDIDFAKSGTWLLTVRYGFTVLSVTKPGLERELSVGGEEPQPTVTAAFNNAGNLIAYGTDKKRVYISGWDGHSFDLTYIEGFGPIKHEVQIWGSLDHTPIKLAIAPNNKWLAVQFNEGLELRDMSSGFFPQQSQVTLPQTSNGVLEFSPSGTLLAVGHAQGMRVYSVPDLKLLLDKPGAQTTAIAFSPDGCLLAWGDKEGIVHTISSPQP